DGRVGRCGDGAREADQYDVVLEQRRQQQLVVVILLLVLEQLERRRGRRRVVTPLIRPSATFSPRRGEKGDGGVALAPLAGRGWREAPGEGNPHRFTDA